MVREDVSLGIDYLRDYWERSQSLRMPASGEESWVRDQTLLCGLRLNLLETGRYLHEVRPTLEEFEAWTLERNSGHIERKRWSG